ncbi:MAG TPA: hypothetical protein VF766_03345 [Pyrinomonadaceae bacterium]
MRQYEAVIQAMRENGGYATLGHLYRTATKIEGSNWEGTKTPFASIRRIVQIYPHHFFRIRPGLWGLTAEKERVIELFDLAGKPSRDKVEEFDHSYYQGLLLEIGKLEGYKTFVPHQDKNRPFLTRKLSDISTLKQFPEFTYTHLLKRGRTVDVAWFNERTLPYAFFEVEHSTDIRNSLQKFAEFRDFRIKFRIVADAARLRDFKSKLESSIFAPISSEVEFFDYQAIAEWHTAASKLAALREVARLR